MNNIKIVTTFESAQNFLFAAGQNASEVRQLWQEHMIDPYWKDISKWAPFDQSFKKPSYVEDLAALEKQLPILSAISLVDLESKFLSISNELPLEDDDELAVFLYPACDSDKTLKEWQNGVVGTVVFGNIIIRINPLADNFLEWIPFVFAHEYHHNVWGYHHFVLNRGRDTDGSFLEYMITEGQADLFAESLFPGLIPQWNRPFDNETEIALWNRIKPILQSKDQEVHSLFMFGKESENLPWCVGYSFGKMIVSDFLREHSALSFSELLAIPARQILQGSKYRGDIVV